MRKVAWNIGCLMAALVFFQSQLMAAMEDEVDEAQSMAQDAAESASDEKVNAQGDKAAASAAWNGYNGLDKSHLTPEEADEAAAFSLDAAAEMGTGNAYFTIANLKNALALSYYQVGLAAQNGTGVYAPNPNPDAAVYWFGQAADAWEEAEWDYVDASCSYNMAEESWGEAAEIVIEASVSPECLICGEPDTECDN